MMLGGERAPAVLRDEAPVASACPCSCHPSRVPARPGAGKWRRGGTRGSIQARCGVGKSRARAGALSLERLVELQDQSYRLLQWLNRQLVSGAVSYGSVHREGTTREAFKAWIERARATLPQELRPAAADLEVVANLFASYLETSFEVVERRIAPGCPCTCMMCLYLRDATFLKLRRVSPAAKKQARELELICLERLTAALDLPLVRADLETLVDEPGELARDLALVTWADELARRARGPSQGPGVLVLWRAFAWRGGRPDRAFELDAARIRAAEERVRARLAALGAA